MVRRWFYWSLGAVVVVEVLFGLFWPPGLWSLVVVAPLAALGLWDALQREHTILRNFPLIGHGRYLFEMVRPEIQQYFIESNIDAHPIEREMRSIVYQRAKNELETKPFGTERNVYRVGYEWAAHALAEADPPEEDPRVLVGGDDCDKPYSASLFNVSAMSYGSISSPATRALNRGAARGGFAQNTGEGGVAPEHLEGGDLIWQIGTGYFGCRSKDGGFDEAQYRDTAQRDEVKMIELKLSQGAKPGHGGVLPGCKVTPVIASIRGVPVGETVQSPARHRTFKDPKGLLEFVARLREGSGGKPTGFKVTLGARREFLSICKAMRETGILPDFITVDGGEGGTGAAPLEFSNSIGMPARDAWVFVHNALNGAGLRDKVRVLASGKIMTGFHIVRALALGADACYSARGMMFALGCIQALRCNADTCPTGVTTTNPALYKGLVVPEKAERVYRYHKGTIGSVRELLGAMGVSSPEQVHPGMIYRRVDDMKVRSFNELYDYVQPGAFLNGDDSIPDELRTEWGMASADRFA